MSITEENESNDAETSHNDDDDNASKESFNEKVMNTNINDNAKEEDDSDAQSRKDKMLRRKSLAPAKHE